MRPDSLQQKFVEQETIQEEQPRSRDPGTLYLVQSERIKRDSAVTGRVQARFAASRRRMAAHVVAGKLSRREVHDRGRIASRPAFLRLRVVAVRREQFDESELTIAVATRKQVGCVDH